MYSDLVIKNTTIDRLMLLQLIGVLLIVTINLVVDCLVSLQPAQPASDFADSVLLYFVFIKLVSNFSYQMHSYEQEEVASDFVFLVHVRF